MLLSFYYCFHFLSQFNFLNPKTMSTPTIYPKITLVGAGPGDADLITIKGINALSEADVVLYDALVNPELLKYVPLNAKKIYVGKREGHHTFSQEQINKIGRAH